MKRIMILLCAVVMVFAAKTKAETIFEKFDVDPLTNGWSKTEAAGTTFNYATGYNSSGYVDATITYDTTKAAARFTRALSTAYSESQEFWLEMDIANVVNFGSWTQTGYLGVMKSGDTSNETNLIGERLFYDYAFSNPEFPSSDRGNRIDPYVYSNDGTCIWTPLSGPKSNPKWGYGDPARQLAFGDNGYRAKLHYWQDGGIGYVTSSVWAINTDGTATTKMYDSSTVDDTGSTSIAVLGLDKTLSLDSLGLANRTNFSAIAATSLSEQIYVDNMYFSTDSVNPIEETPSWIPEPATVLLLGLGGVILRKRRAY